MAVAGLLSYLADAIAGDAGKGGEEDDARKRMGDALRRFDAKSLEGAAKDTGKGAARAVDLKALLPEREVHPQNFVYVTFGDTPSSINPASLAVASLTNSSFIDSETLVMKLGASGVAGHKIMAPFFEVRCDQSYDGATF